jgi:D-alanine transaminase
LPRFAYVDGAFVRHAEASVHIEDRGYQFADAVYEVWSVQGGRLRDREGHFQRLERSLGELRIPNPRSQAAYETIIAELLRRNRLSDALVYLQVSRGVARRDHIFPDPAPDPTIVLTAKGVDYAAWEAKAEKGVGVITVPDQRWKRCDIKTVGLLPNVLARQAAQEAGAAEAWMVDETGHVTEGGSSNAWIVSPEGALITRPADNAILNGVTRRAAMACAEQAGLTLEERAFTVEEAKQAREAFITSASTFVTPVVRIDDAPVGNGAPGSVATLLRQVYREMPL